MSNESTKTRIVRGSGFLKKYFSGRVIDIGCGADLVADSAEPFDLPHGDAEKISSLRDIEGYDTVHSSHCLEHMSNVPEALAQWWSLVKPEGYMIIVVPDEDLYEQGCWPSLFNTDHKATFRLKKSVSWSPNSYEVIGLFNELKNIKIIHAERQDFEYDYKLQRNKTTTFGKFLFRTSRFLHLILQKAGVKNHAFEQWISFLFFKIGAPVDQTLGPALAQI